MLLRPAMEHDERAGPHAPRDVTALSVLVVGGHRPPIAHARAALARAGHAALRAGDLDAALELLDDADVVVVDPGDDEALLPALSGAMAPETPLLVYGDHYRWLGRLARSITVVPAGALPALLDVVEGVRIRHAAERAVGAGGRALPIDAARRRRPRR